jgi:1,4-alpha-glucan branching enzyme
MNTAATSEFRTGATSGIYSARRSLPSVTFYCDAPSARRVAVIGDFSQWSPNAHPMTRMPDGQWMIRVDLPHGRYRYLFVVDGQPRLDRRAHGTVREANAWLDAASLLDVS